MRAHVAPIGTERGSVTRSSLVTSDAQEIPAVGDLRSLLRLAEPRAVGRKKFIRRQAAISGGSRRQVAARGGFGVLGAGGIRRVMATRGGRKRTIRHPGSTRVSRVQFGVPPNCAPASRPTAPIAPNQSKSDQIKPKKMFSDCARVFHTVLNFCLLGKSLRFDASTVEERPPVRFRPSQNPP